MRRTSFLALLLALACLSLAGGAAQEAVPVPDPNLILWYTYAEEAEQRIADHSGSG